jgi:hypothetical protein
VRFEATIPDGRAAAAIMLASDLGLSRSQLIDEALSLFLMATIEAKRDRKLVTVDRQTGAVACELTTPTLATLAWNLGSAPTDHHADADIGKP